MHRKAPAGDENAPSSKKQAGDLMPISWCPTGTLTGPTSGAAAGRVTEAARAVPMSSRPAERTMLSVSSSAISWPPSGGRIARTGGGTGQGGSSVVVKSGSPPNASNSLRFSKWPALAAWCTAVRPSLGLPHKARLASARADRSAATMPTSGSAAATISGVMPSIVSCLPPQSGTVFLSVTTSTDARPSRSAQRSSKCPVPAA
mmetsp:Transcript_114223/g.317991  ORF Transcript_114223/g.317991 Transcript_114223/m.317991 type:complete len:203 (+) Transcript_114223:431-1039(+)